MGEKLKAGVIGLGILGSQHVQFLANQLEVDVVGVADIRICSKSTDWTSQWWRRQIRYTGSQFWLRSRLVRQP